MTLQAITVAPCTVMCGLCESECWLLTSTKNDNDTKRLLKDANCARKLTGMRSSNCVGARTWLSSCHNTLAWNARMRTRKYFKCSKMQTRHLLSQQHVRSFLDVAHHIHGSRRIKLNLTVATSLFAHSSSVFRKLFVYYSKRSKLGFGFSENCENNANHARNFPNLFTAKCHLLNANGYETKENG